MSQKNVVISLEAPFIQRTSYLLIKLFACLLFVIVLSISVKDVHAEESDLKIGTYDAYKESVQNICYATDNPAISWNSKSTFGGRDLPEVFLTISRNDYPNMFSSNSNQEFEKGIQ